MITLITGTPGAGKTAWLVNQLLKLQVTQPHRRLLAHGIKQFKLSHIQIFCRNPKCEMCGENEFVVESLKQSNPDEFNAAHDLVFIEDWPQWKKPNDLIVVDEVQRAWKTKAGTPMDSIALLDTHRHHGLDFWLLTQSPKLLHIDVRVMVSRHIHLDGTWSGRKEYEWSEVQENTKSRLGAVERPYKLPTKVYKYYKSAEVHTKLEKRVPLSLYATAAALVFAVIMVFVVVNRIHSRTATIDETENKQPVAGVAASAAGTATGVAPAPASASAPAALVTYDDYIKAMTPVVPMQPWTAPIYKDLAKPVSFPVIQGCILQKLKKGEVRCQCYSQQNTVIYMRQEACQTYVIHRPFNMFKPDDMTLAANGQSAQAENLNRNKFGSNVP